MALTWLSKAQIGALIKGFREKRGWSQRELAERLGKPGSQSQVSLWEKGTHKPQWDTLEAIAEMEGSTVEDLFMTDAKPPTQHVRLGTARAPMTANDVTAHTQPVRVVLGDEHSAVVRERSPEYIPLDDEGRPLLDEIDQLMEWLPEGMSRRFVRHVTRRVRLGELYAYGIEQGWAKERLDRIDAARKALDEILDRQDQEASGGGG